MDFNKGDKVKDINPDCPHFGAEGTVTDVGDDTITFAVSNNGEKYKSGDVLEKTVDQMTKLKESIRMKKSELRQIIKEEVQNGFFGIGFKQLNEMRPPNTFGIMSRLTKGPDLKKLISSSTISDGIVGLFRSKDGNAYEVVVRPAAYGKYKGLFKKYLEK